MVEFSRRIASTAASSGTLPGEGGRLNEHGGTLLFGVDDDGRLVRVEEDFPLLGANQNTDGWELRLTPALTSAC